MEQGTELLAEMGTAYDINEAISNAAHVASQVDGTEHVILLDHLKKLCELQLRNFKG